MLVAFRHHAAVQAGVGCALGNHRLRERQGGRAHGVVFEGAHIYFFRPTPGLLAGGGGDGQVDGEYYMYTKGVSSPRGCEADLASLKHPDEAGRIFPWTGSSIARVQIAVSRRIGFCAKREPSF